MYRGAQLNKGELLTSWSGRFKAVMEQEGNFVLYVGKRVLWTTNSTTTATNAAKSGFQLVMQNDGNLALLDLNGDQVWASLTNSFRSRADYLICADDGNLVLFNNNSMPVWSTNITQSMKWIKLLNLLLNPNIFLN